MILVHIFKEVVLLGIHWEQIDLLEYMIVNCFSCVLFNRSMFVCVNIVGKRNQCMTVVLSSNKSISNVDKSMEQVISLYILVCSRLLDSFVEFLFDMLGLMTTLPLFFFLDHICWF